APPASAATIEVKNLDDSGPDSLRAAILQAQGDSAADVITFQAGLTGTINLTSGGLPTIGYDTTITGPGAGVITISGGGTARPFNIAGSGGARNVNINNLTITNGAAGGVDGGAISATSANLTLDHVVVSNSTATRGGGV